MERISTGPYHTTYKVGDIRVTSLRDGYVDMPTGRLRQPGDRTFGGDLPAQVSLVDGALRLSVNAFAIDDGHEITLIDTGSSNAWHPTMGFLPQALSEAKIAVDRIRSVAFTHTHLDHIHGLILPDGRDGFPQLARLLVPRPELDMFRSEARLSRFHDRAQPLDPGQRLSASIEAIATPGHEIGHTCFRVTSRGETLLVWGDLVHVPSLQFDRPEVAWEFDGDQEQARASRLQILALAADNAYCVAGAHLDSPGVGRISRTETGFRFEPL
ncbi:MBL fold metallo-hydrolase [Mesorhizobium captivum]|uniref:MBL fold metallo-hydrolase n=1 Tax=Mesorhizobium captivum TaxID=3072319 RepID=A0ABU4Z6Y9_9HYPH|nr:MULTISPECIES: MBL fold metallo-hydrolase [unclassified Mesorhizobium]MDX8444343.1 MBL fold metallo-hydrolase [Mesorhizobium sp. VK3C]MDX8494363.1 MBL fold metallo-hydrolase [Mesorhizobium sp. VK22B]